MREPTAAPNRVSEPALVHRDDAGPDRVERQLDAIAQSQLLEDVVDVRLDRDLADAELPSHLGVAQPERDVAHDLPLAAGERGGHPPTPARRPPGPPRPRPPHPAPRARAQGRPPGPRRPQPSDGAAR